MSSGRITARGKVTKAGKRMLFAESVLVDENGREIARGSGTFARSAIALSETSDYVG